MIPLAFANRATQKNVALLTDRRNEKIMEEREIRAICKQHQLECNKITKVIGSFEKELFIVDDNYLIRTSKNPMFDEYNKIDRIKNLKHIPKIVYTSDQGLTYNKSYYIVLEYLKGSELFSIFNELSYQNIHSIGIEIANFLFDLHSIKGEKYDIGHYVPVINSCANY